MERILTTRQRRRLARKMEREQPLFAFVLLCEMVTDYSVETFIRDIQPTKRSKYRKGKSIKLVRARHELHQELVRLLDVKNPSNKTVTHLMLNHENKTKPFIFRKKIGEETFRVVFDRNWPLTLVRQTASELLSIKTIEELNARWKEITRWSAV